MASSGGESSALTLRRRESLICALCLDIFRSPKLLSCSHTYCEHCLKDLVDQRKTNKFPCPHCREEIKVPPGGVSQLQTNFYLDPEDLEQARNSSECPRHLRRELEFFCIQCDMQICLSCKLTDHEMHPTQDLQKQVNNSRLQLSRDAKRLRQSVANAEKSVEMVKKEQEAVKAKRASLVTNIVNRHAAVVATADKYRDEALASLDKAADDLSALLDVELYCAQENLKQLCDRSV